MTDRELINLYFVENKRHYAFNLMVRSYSKKLYWLIRRIVLVHEDADDVLQNTFIKVWKSLPQFKGNSSLYSWMYRIATNEALTYIKKKKRNFSIDNLSAADELKDDPYFDGDEAYTRFLLAIETLPEKQKLVFKMKYFEEMKYREIADILGGTEGSLKASYFHAVQKIEKILTPS